jgi:hypothetical protein
MQNENIHCKVFYNNEFRRFPLPRGFTLADLTLKIKTIINLDVDFIVKYKDEEEDWITISSDLELETGLSLCNSNLFRLTISTISAPNNTSPDNATSCPEEERYVPAHRRCGRRGKRFHGKQDEECDEKEKGGYRGCGRRGWKKFHNEDEEGNENEGCGRRGRRGRRGRWGRGRWGDRSEWKKHHKDTEGEEISSGESNEEDLTLSLNEIKKEIESLKEEVTLLLEKKKKSAEECKEVKERIKAKRQDDNATKEEILDLRTELQNKKSSFRPLWAQISSNKRRIRKLQGLAANKSE